MPPPPRPVPIVGLALLLACTVGEPAGEPRLVDVGMVTLEEAGDTELTVPAGFAVGPNGSIYVADARAGLVGFSADGRFERRFGTTGDGPGEYRWPTAPHVPDDSTLLVADMGRFSLTAFDLRSGGFREQQEDAGAILVVRHNEDGFLLGMVVPPMNFVLHQVATVTGPVRPLATLPSPDVEQAAGVINVAVATRDELVLAGAGLSNQLVRIMDGRVRDTLDIPRHLRRGVPEDLAGRFAATPPDRWMTLYSTQWLVVPFGRRVAVVHVELDPLDEAVSPPRAPFTVRSWLTVLTEDLTQACTDLLVPISGDIHPFIASSGDTLLVLDHYDTGDDIRTAVRRFLVDTEGCAWQPVRGGSGG